MPAVPDRLSPVLVAATSPLLLFAFIPLLLLWALAPLGLAVWVCIVWGLGAVAVVATIGLSLPPQPFVAKTTFGAEVSQVGGLVRGGLALFVAAVVGAIGAIAVQRDFNPETSGNGEIMSLLTIVAEVLILVVVIRVLYGIAFRVHVADPAARTRAATQVMARAFATVRTHRLRGALRHPVYVHWQAVFSARRAYWMAATIGALGALYGVTTLIQ